MDAGGMENRRKQGDGIRQYKLWHPVVLTVFQALVASLQESPAGIRHNKPVRADIINLSLGV